MTHEKKHYFDIKVLGQPSGLFFLFFTEMWERFLFMECAFFWYNSLPLKFS